MQDPMYAADRLSSALKAIREGEGLSDLIEAHGLLEWRLWSEEGDLLVEGASENLLTTYGDEWSIRRLLDATPASGPITGMRLGTGTTAPSKSGAGAAIVAYAAGSSRALDGGFPTVAAIGVDVGWRATYRTTYPAGVASVSGLAEAVMTNIAIADVAGAAGNTTNRGLLSPVVNKGASDTLELTWTISHNGT